MPKYIINGRFLTHKITGVERYANEILHELDKIVKPGDLEIAIPKEVKSAPNFDRISVVRVGKLHNRAWEHISFPFYVVLKKAISVNLCNVSPLFNPGIVCLMDAKIKAHPEFYKKTFLYWYLLLFFNASKRAKRIITISNFSKDELLKYYSIKPDKIDVIPCAWQHFSRVSYDENTLLKYSLNRQQFIFSMCSLEPNKNFKWIAEVARNNPNIVFAVAGSINPGVFSDGLGFPCPDNMRLIGYISDEEAKTLMRDCKAFVFPTIYEGFGMPPLEALSAGCKCVIVSDSPVMHEVFGTSVTYINPYEYVLPKMEENNDCEIVLDKYDWKRSAILLKDLLDLGD